MLFPNQAKFAFKSLFLSIVITPFSIRPVEKRGSSPEPNQAKQSKGRIRDERKKRLAKLPLPLTIQCKPSFTSRPKKRTVRLGLNADYSVLRPKRTSREQHLFGNFEPCNFTIFQRQFVKTCKGRKNAASIIICKCVEYVGNCFVLRNIGKELYPI